MLADQIKTIVSGRLSADVHQKGEWLLSVIAFVYQALPHWRDDPERPHETGENALTGNLCQFLNSAKQGTAFEIVVFQTEVRDPDARNRVLDIVALPQACRLWIGQEFYTIYDPIVPIECKRLPTPRAVDRDPREYLHTRLGGLGGVQRFRAGQHGGSHSVAAMVGYVQERTANEWITTVNAWVGQLENEALAGWTVSEELTGYQRNNNYRTAQAQSVHQRTQEQGQLVLHHLWVEM